MESTITKHDLLRQATEVIENSGFPLDSWNAELMNDVAKVIEDDAACGTYTNDWDEEKHTECASITADLVTAFLKMCDSDSGYQGYGWYGNDLGTVHGNAADTDNPEWCEDYWDYLNVMAWVIEHNSNVRYEDEWDVAYFGDGEEPRF